MEQTRQRGPETAAKVVIALGAGIVVFLLLVPSGGVDSLPPRCSSIFNLYSVPCDGWVAPVAGVATAAVVGLVLWWKDRGSRRTRGRGWRPERRRNRAVSEKQRRRQRHSIRVDSADFRNEEPGNE